MAIKTRLVLQSKITETVKEIYVNMYYLKTWRERDIVRDKERKYKNIQR